MAKSPQDNAMFRHLGLGVQFAATLVGGCLIGVWVDRNYATAPWGVVIGATIGFAGGFYNFLRMSLRALREGRKSVPDRRAE